MLFLLSFYAIIALSVINAAPTPTDTYANSDILQTPDMYYLFWNYTQTDIIFEIHVKTTGWAGFGLSPNGGMDGSDVVIFSVDSNGKSNFTDRHINGRSVLVDKTQNWFPIVVSSKDGYLMAKFTRKIKICDQTNEDRDIIEGTVFTIYAYGSKFDNGDISYHDFRAQKSLPLISSLNRNVNLNMNEVETVEYRVNATLDPAYSTIYYCQVFKLPANWTTIKRHLIRYETLYTAGTEKHYHHWVMNECSKQFETDYLSKNPFPQPGYCVTDNSVPGYWANIMQYCMKVSLVWAIGSSSIQDFPDDLAYPLGGSDNEFKYFYLEIHYDNPNHENIIDQSGFKMYVTKNYRKTEFGVLTLGTSVAPTAIMVPPNAEKFNTVYGCGRTCTDKMLNDTSEIKVFSSMPHTHLIGREVYATVIRDNKEVAYITNNKNYDFNYQFYNFLANPVVVKRGDELKVTCVYNSKSKSEFTYAGFGSQKEMCFSFVWYYPKIQSISSCTEEFSDDQVNSFMDKLVKNGVLKSGNITNGKFEYVLSPTTTDVDFAQKFQEIYFANERHQSCDSAADPYFSYVAQASRAIPMDAETCTTSTDNAYLSTTVVPVSSSKNTQTQSTSLPNSAPSSLTILKYLLLLGFIVTLINF